MWPEERTMEGEQVEPWDLVTCACCGGTRFSEDETNWSGEAECMSCHNC